MKLLLPAFALLLLAPPPAPGAEMGRMFFTPQQRASLDSARAQRVRTAVATEPTEEAPAKPPSPEVVTYGGVVRRSDGSTTVWLNNRLLTGKEAAGAPMLRGVRPDGSVILQAPQSGRDVSLRVGQRAELLSGNVEEGYLSRPAPKPDSAPEPAQAARAGAAPPSRAADAAPAVNAETRKEERDQREQLEDAIRALKEAAAAKAAATPPQQPGAAPALQPQ